MADIAFHRKYRPRNIAGYMGDEIKDILLSRFSDESKYPQTILLYGTRGCGKTSAARLIAKEYHCINKIDGHACGKCEMCLEIEERLINSQVGVDVQGVQELDIASDSGKAAIDEVLEDALIEPMYPYKYKILILDECHMATKQAQNRLLKIVEEPPKHLVFIFCTTDPDQLLDTLNSRCQLKIEVKKPSVDELANRLLWVCQQEKITTSMEALKMIAKKAERIPREALNILEDVAKNCGNQVTLETIRSRTGEVAVEIYMQYYQAANDSLEKVMLFNKSLKEQNIPPKNFIRGLTRFTLDCINIRYAIGIDEYPMEYVNAVKKFFSMYNSEELDALLQIVEYANKFIDNDDTKAELIITTTAMRIGKLKLLAVGLTNERLEAEKENKRSLDNYKKRIDQEKEESKKVIQKKIDSPLLVSVFGKNVSEVKAGPNLEVIEDDDDGDEENSRALSDEELLSWFS